MNDRLSYSLRMYWRILILFLSCFIYFIKIKNDLTLIIFPVERLLAMKIGPKNVLEIYCNRSASK